MQWPASDKERNRELRVSDELLKMPVITLEWVIKIKKRENMNSGVYTQEEKRPGDEEPRRGGEETLGPKDLKGKPSPLEREKERKDR